EALGWYRKDDVRSVGLGPEHDWSSHAADAFGLMCLVAELMDRTWIHACAADQVDFCGGIAISGLFNLAPVSRSFQNDTLQLTDEEVKRFSPLCRGLDLGAPLLVAVGGDETGEFLCQSAEFAAHARAHGVPVEHQVVARANHITGVLDELAVSDRPLNRATRALLGPV
ncbi:MAG: hypothetical protein FJY42_09795, partial [Betaproteobacteria bacterium]|nr:hypothetical protein [Betaproteobacteria bacterium]